MDKERCFSSETAILPSISDGSVLSKAQPSSLMVWTTPLVSDTAPLMNNSASWLTERLMLVALLQLRTEQALPS